MKTWVKVLLGILAIPVLLILLGISVLVATGRWGKVTGLASNARRIMHGSDGLKALEQAYPFTPPADGRLREDRLLAYLSVCEKVKPVAEPFSQWIQAHHGQPGGLKEAQEITQQLGGILEASIQALGEQKMGAREFEWMVNTLAQARQEVAEKAGSPTARDMLDSLKALAPELPAKSRDRLEPRLAAWEKSLRQSAEPLSANGELYLRHAARLRAVNIELLLKGLSAGGKQKQQNPWLRKPDPAP